MLIRLFGPHRYSDRIRTLRWVNRQRRWRKAALRLPGNS